MQASELESHANFKRMLEPVMLANRPYAMKTITLLTVAAMLLASATAESSVGGPATELLIVILAMWAVGVYEAWSKRVGLLGWVAMIVLSVIGGAAGVAIGSMVMEMTLSLTHFQGSLAKSNSPLLYILTATMAILSVLGSWSAIQIAEWARRSLRSVTSAASP